MMTKFQQAKERADILEEVVNSMTWTKENTEANIKNWKEKVENAEEGEDMSWETDNIERYEFRLSVIQEVERMLEKML